MSGFNVVLRVMYRTATAAQILIFRSTSRKQGLAFLRLMVNPLSQETCLTGDGAHPASTGLLSEHSPSFLTLCSCQTQTIPRMAANSRSQHVQLVTAAAAVTVRSILNKRHACECQGFAEVLAQEPLLFTSAGKWYPAFPCLHKCMMRRNLPRKYVSPEIRRLYHEHKAAVIAGLIEFETDDEDLQVHPPSKQADPGTPPPAGVSSCSSASMAASMVPGIQGSTPDSVLDCRLFFIPLTVFVHIFATRLSPCSDDADQATHMDTSQQQQEASVGACQLHAADGPQQAASSKLLPQLPTAQAESTTSVDAVALMDQGLLDLDAAEVQLTDDQRLQLAWALSSRIVASWQQAGG
jgi:hypothetical protein